ncbi:uncharacterized protein TNCV_3344331 [Trichonephila clavipes]|nr:uncharacterized protein TNCV_3344331 [Trichonephila clavipes]
MTATSSSTGSSRAMRLGFRTSPRKPSSSHCIGGIVDLRSGRNSNKRCRVRKVISTGFWDRKGILLIDFLPRGETVDIDCLMQVLCSSLRDNARPHTARRTAAVLTEFGRELFDHSPYSFDLAPSDFHFFLHLTGERFGKDEELKTSVTRWFHSQVAEFSDRVIEKLNPRFSTRVSILAVAMLKNI